MECGGQAAGEGVREGEGTRWEWEGEREEFEGFLRELGYPYVEETGNEVYGRYLRK